MITPPLSISARPVLTVKVASSRGVSPFCCMRGSLAGRYVLKPMSVDAVFVRDGDLFTATDLALGPWAPAPRPGGAPAALLAPPFAHPPPPPGRRPARLTYEFVRPVPQGPLAISI